MPKVTYKNADGTEELVQGSVGTTIMQTAVARGITGILGECGGNLMCATCHVYVSDEWLEQLPDKSEDEDDMLDETEEPRRDNSRLSCQVKLNDDLDGIVVTLPETQ